MCHFVPVPGRSELTSEEIVSLASSLRDVGVSRFTWGDLTLYFEPRGEIAAEESAQVEPSEPSPVERAALALTNRGRAA